MSVLDIPIQTQPQDGEVVNLNSTDQQLGYLYSIGLVLGVSEDAPPSQTAVKPPIQETYSFLSETSIRLSESVNTLTNIYSNCKEENWDGYEAQKITEACLQNTYNFLQKLPPHLPMPEILPDPSGTFMLFWENDDQSLGVTINDKAEISYGGLTKEGGHVYGSIPYQGHIPLNLLNEISLFK